MKDFERQLAALGACEEAREWAGQFKTAQEAWDECNDGSWMLWILGRTINCEPWTDGRKPLLACALDCAMTAKKYWPAASKDRIAKAVGVLRNWIKGKASTEDAQQARRDLHAYAANYADYAAYAAAAAADYAAYDAAYAASYAAAAAAAAAYAAYAAYAADATDATDAKIAGLSKCAAIVRKHYPKPPEPKKGRAQ